MFFSTSSFFSSGINVNIQGVCNMMTSGATKRYWRFGWGYWLHFLLFRPWNWRQHPLLKVQYLCVNAASFVRIFISPAAGTSNSHRINMFLWRMTTQFNRDFCEFSILFKNTGILYNGCMWIDYHFWRDVHSPVCRTAAQIILSIDFSALWHQSIPHAQISVRTVQNPTDNGKLHITSANRQTPASGLPRTQLESREVWRSYSSVAEDLKSSATLRLVNL
jgi:hypothetical protein